MKILNLVILSIILSAAAAQARPVSYPGGLTGMLMNNGDSNSVHVHYSPTAKMSVGYKGEYWRDSEYQIHAVQVNNLLKRWNKPESQANIYLKSGAGIAYSDFGAHENEIEPAFFTGFATDWEDRRRFISYENRFTHAGDIASGFEQSARVGYAPYEGDYGDLHTWLMLEVKHIPENADHFTVTPLVRFFKGVHLVEIGMNDNKEALFNWVIRY